MPLYRILQKGTAHAAPHVAVIDGADQPWQGKPAAELTEADIEAVFDFAEDEGLRAGRFDADTGRAHDSLRANPFHPEFLGGLAHGAWRLGYRRAYAGTQRIRALAPAFAPA